MQENRHFFSIIIQKLRLNEIYLYVQKPDDESYYVKGKTTLSKVGGVGDERSRNIEEEHMP